MKIRNFQKLRAFINTELFRGGKHSSTQSDVFQETILRCLQCKGAQLRPNSPLLCGIARNVIRESKYGRTVRMALFSEMKIESEALIRDEPEVAESHLEQQETAAWIASALRTLRIDQREILLARFWEGKRVSEIATERRMEVEATKSLLRRSLEALRRALRAQGCGGRYGGKTGSTSFSGESLTRKPTERH